MSLQQHRCDGDGGVEVCVCGSVCACVSENDNASGRKRGEGDGEVKLKRERAHGESNGCVNFRPPTINSKQHSRVYFPPRENEPAQIPSHILHRHLTVFFIFFFWP